MRPTPAPDHRNRSSDSVKAGTALDFVVRLFVVPATVVLAIVLLWILYRWLTLAPATIDITLDELEGRGRQRWRAAVHLAGLLNDPAYDHLRDDVRLARRLTETLRREIDRGKMDAQSIALRVYLARALGEFRLAEGVTVLIEAASTDRGPRETAVRRSAIEALAVLTDTLGTAPLSARGNVAETLVSAAEDTNPKVRSAGAFALGVWGDELAQQALGRLLEDPQAEVRYNAATGLARHGDRRAVDVLIEMLQVGKNDPLRTDKDAGAGMVAPSEAPEQALVELNAIRALQKLLDSTPDPNYGPRIRDAVEPLARSSDIPAVRVEAECLLERLP